MEKEESKVLFADDVVNGVRRAKKKLLPWFEGELWVFVSDG